MPGGELGSVSGRAGRSSRVRFGRGSSSSVSPAVSSGAGGTARLRVGTVLRRGRVSAGERVGEGLDFLGGKSFSASAGSLRSTCWTAKIFRHFARGVLGRVVSAESSASTRQRILERYSASPVWAKARPGAASAAQPKRNCGHWRVLNENRMASVPFRVAVSTSCHTGMFHPCRPPRTHHVRLSGPTLSTLTSVKVLSRNRGGHLTP